MKQRLYTIRKRHRFLSQNVKVTHNSEILGEHVNNTYNKQNVIAYIV